MQVLSYSPKVEAYARVGDGVVVDLSQDIISAGVVREIDASSTFNITLQNKGGKYNGMFGCFDGIVIYATKSERVKLFTGYITEFDVFKLYDADFKISGLCTLYRLQQLYWDPQLMSSQELMRNDWSLAGGFDNGCMGVATRLLTNVAKWPEDGIFAQEKIPDDVVAWATELYAMKADDMSQARQMVDEFYEILQTHGPKFSSTSTSAKSSGAAGESGGLKLSGDEAKASDDQKKIASVAISGTVPGEGGMCLGWVNQVYQAAGFVSGLLGSDGAVDVWRGRASAASYSSDLSKIPLGACLVGSGSGSAGAIYGHIGIYVGSGQVVSEVGASSGPVQESVESFYAWQTASCDGYVGAMGWVCPGDCGIDWR